MEGIGCEVSHKIRAAIKAKLIELGAYVDDELPDYIMVMVANKRTRAQMDEDLQLFLSSNTKIFTSWLHTVLQKLQEVTVASFEGKKDSEDKKTTKRKKSEDRSKKSSEEPPDKVKKHTKKHKEGKKSKKNKHKTKDKGKEKKSEGKGRDEKRTSQDDEKKSKTKKLQLNEAVGRAILGNLKNKKVLSEENDSSNGQSSSEEGESHVDVEKNDKEKSMAYNDYDVLNIKLDDEPGGLEMDCNKSNRKEPIEDEFNIEPLQPTEKEENAKLFPQDNSTAKDTETNIQVEKTISAPTQELLKEHDKIQSQKQEGEENSQEKKKPQSDSEESISPEEIRKQLLLIRAKKKLEESKKADRMRSNSPDVLIVTETGKPKDLLPAPSRQPDTVPSRTVQGDYSKEPKASSPRRRRRSTSTSSHRSHSSDWSSYKKESKTKTTETKSSNDDKRKVSLSKTEKIPSGEDRQSAGTSREKKKNVIKISESLELERNMGLKKDSERQSKEKESGSRRRMVSSRVVTVVGPEEPEIPSIVKVKPREFVPKDKQANKTLLLKAVADAEKSIATVQPRVEIEPAPKKEALYTKNLREKRYGKLAITVSNIRQSPDSRDRLLSVNSEKSDKKHDSSDVSDGMRNKSDLLSRKISKSDDQFISSKTSVMENNEKYIRCWLEGVEKAVKEDEMFNPNEMEDFVHSSFSDEENGLEKDGKPKKRKLPEASTDLSPGNQNPSEREAAVESPDGKPEAEPQIVVTLDGLDSDTLQDLILKNKDAVSRQMLTVDREKTSREKGGKGFEKINDRFGRLNRVAEDFSGKGDKKCETDKKEKTSSESKNRQLIAQLSEKFGKVDREFENRKRKRPDDDRRYTYGSRRGGEEGAGDRNGRYRRSIREGGFRLYRRS